MIWQKIINITPDSFSDGGVCFSSQALIDNFIDSYKQGVRNFDFGAQSTAPSSKSISFDEEISRFESCFIPFINNSKVLAASSDCTFSFDTFRPATINFLIDVLSSNRVRPKELYWNDVSGVIDDSSIKFLENDDNVKLVLCHNITNGREVTSDHYKYQLAEEGFNFLDQVVSFFRDRLSKIPSYLHNKVIIDPCFGFSKNFSQNKFLFDNLSYVFDRLNGHTALIGISRKRFVREISGLSIDQKEELDLYQKRMLRRALPISEEITHIIRSHSNPFSKK